MGLITVEKKKCPVIYNMLCITMFKLCLCLDVKEEEKRAVVGTAL